MNKQVALAFKMREHVFMSIPLSIPNFLTLLRISLIPIFVLMFYLPVQWSYTASAVIFGIAALTDWLDGFLARQLKQTSPLGEFLDPVADKMMVAVALVLLVQGYASVQPMASIFLALPAAIIVCREIVISALREWMAELGKRRMVAVSWLGKLKTVSQMLAILLLLSQNPKYFTYITFFGYILMYAAAILTLWSMLVYLRAAWSELISDTH